MVWSGLLSENKVPEFPGLSGLATLSLNPSVPIVVNGDMVRVDLDVSSVINLSGVQISISYNPSVLKYISLSEGTFLSSGRGSTIFLNTNKTSSGQINDIAIARFNNGVSGSGVIASVFFQAISTGSSNVRFTQIHFSDQNGNSINNIMVVNLTLTIVNFADADGDGVADAIDKCHSTPISTKATRFGCPFPPGSDDFDPTLSTNLSDVDLFGITNFRVGKTNLGQIVYGSQAINLSENMAAFRFANLSRIFVFTPNAVRVNSSLFQRFNQSSTVTLFNLVNISNPKILRDGTPCLDCRIVSFSNNIIVFTVPHHTDYFIDEGSICGDSLCSSQESCSSCSLDCWTCPSGSSSSSGGETSGGVGGGGGGGSGISYVCNSEWQCNQWTLCSDGLQIRDCSLSIIPQKSQTTPCPNLAAPPLMSQKCESVAEITPVSSTPSSDTPTPVQNTQATEEKKQEDAAYVNPTRPIQKKYLFAYLFGTSVLLVIMILIHKLRASHMDKSAAEGLKSHVEAMRSMGKKDDEIADSLLKAGWTEKDISPFVKVK